MASAAPLIDSFGRHISYVRLSVTDRCDLRCRYCMGEEMEFRPKDEILTFDEILQLSDILIARGVRKIRLTGGEPLVRRGILDLVRELGTRIGQGLDELALTTNGTQLAKSATLLFKAGVRRVNVSLDSLDPETFRQITRRGRINDVIEGIGAARTAGLQVKINMVALKGLNEDEILPMMRWCAQHGHDLTLIETMPLGLVGEDRQSRYLPLDVIRRRLEEQFTLSPSQVRTGGPARYFDVAEIGLRLGLITPLSGNFCAGCNRIRVTASGTVFGCLGHDVKVELRELLRKGGATLVEAALDRLVANKPLRHDFDIGASRPAVERHMSVTGG